MVAKQKLTDSTLSELSQEAIKLKIQLQVSIRTQKALQAIYLLKSVKLKGKITNMKPIYDVKAKLEAHGSPTLNELFPD